MHIPQHMLHGNICPVTLAVSLAGVGSAIYFASKSNDQVSLMRWIGVTVFIFISQMLNFPVTHGTSGHLIGGVLAASLLGVPRAIVSLALILLAQALFLGDGSLHTLGANVLNMSLIGAGLGGLLMMSLQARGASRNISVAIASIVSVVLAAFACTIEVSLSGAVAFGPMFRSMMPVHILIAGSEAVLSVVLCSILEQALNTDKKHVLALRIALCCFGAVLLIPLASQLPDGLQWALAQNL